MIDYYSAFRKPVVASLRADQFFGSFDPLCFMIRVHADFNRIIEANDQAVQYKSSVDTDLITATATQFHETMHWWQIIGTTYGFVDAMSVELQTNSTLANLIEFPDSKLIKPLCNLDKIDQTAKSKHNLNGAINNWMDIEFAHLLAHEPHSIKDLVNLDFFESPGHSFYILYEAFCKTFTNFDKNNELFPDSRQWLQVLHDLKEAKTANYAYGTRMRDSKIGMNDLMEGQARVLEIRYLARARGRNNWEYFEQLGLLGPEYREALNYFTQNAKVSITDGPLCSGTDLFLLFCDIAMNPQAGYPDQINTPETFYLDVHPGLRFARLCRVASKIKNIGSAIEANDRENYDKVAKPLCELFEWNTPPEIAEKITLGAEKASVIKDILVRSDRLLFDPQAIQFEMSLSMHLKHMRSKADRPEFFSWPDVCFESSTGGEVAERTSQQNKDFFDRHTPPFFWFDSDNMIHPNLNLGGDDSIRESLIGNYFLRRGASEIIRQLASREGEFDFDFFWDPENRWSALVKTRVQEELGVSLESIPLIL